MANIFDLLQQHNFEQGQNGLYFSPYNIGEKTASLSVSKNGKGFKCWATNESGNFQKLELHLTGENSKVFKERTVETQKTSRIIFKEENRVVTEPYLIKYIMKRQLTNLVSFFSEISYTDTKYNKTYKGVGRANLSGGVTIRNDMKTLGKINLGKGDITIIESNSDKWVVSEGLFSGLSLYEIKIRKMGSGVELPNLLIMNSTAMAKKAQDYLNGKAIRTENIMLALDNDLSGDIATLKLRGLGKDIRGVFKDFKDPNDMLVSLKSEKVIGKRLMINNESDSIDFTENGVIIKRWKLTNDHKKLNKYEKFARAYGKES